MEISQYLKKLKPEIDKAIEKNLPKKADRKWLSLVFGNLANEFKLSSVDSALLTPLWDFLDRGGKRWRPALFLLFVEAVGGDVKKMKNLVAVPELFHEGSIIIDDVEDQGELRRGKPALHRVFGEDTAINAGNFLYFLPLLILAKNENKFKKEVLLDAYQACIQEMVNIHLGQGMDIFWHKGGIKNPKEKEYLALSSFKTGCLPRLVAKLAVILSGKGKGLADRLGKLAESIGIAFQIQDDILDIALEGKERKGFGKAFGNDIKEGKITLMVIHTLKKANKRDRKRLVEILGKHTDNPKEKREAIDIIERYGGIEYARRKAQRIMKEAWREMDKLLKPSPAKEKLKEFSNYIIERKI